MKENEALDYLMDIGELGEDSAQALYDWYNTTEPNKEDLDKLIKLWENNEFSYWECDLCGEIFSQGDPSSWDDFQGVCQDEGGPVEIIVGGHTTYKEVCGDCLLHNSLFH